jgi:hypothetical protein
MKKVRLLLPLVLLFVAPITAQIEHAATPEQCRADADAWGIPKWAMLVQNDNEFRNLPSAMVRNQAISAKVIEARNSEFATCEKTDSVQNTRYARAARAYSIAELARMGDFMERHNLRGQFYQEDEQGQR